MRESMQRTQPDGEAPAVAGAGLPA